MITRSEFAGLVFCVGVAVLVAACGEAQPEAIRRDQNGMILDPNTDESRTLIVGVGDSIPRLTARNPFVKPVVTGQTSELRLPLLMELNSTYDDQDIVISLGCTSVANVDGDKRFPGVSAAGFRLCDSFDRPEGATKKASALIKSLTSAAPSALNLESFFGNASEEERTRIGGPSLLRKSRAPWDTLMTEQEANLHFASPSASADSVLLGIYLGKKAIVFVGVDGAKRFGGSYLTAAQEAEMTYRVSIGFYLRYDVAIGKDGSVSQGAATGPNQLMQPRSLPPEISRLLCRDVLGGRSPADRGRWALRSKSELNGQ